MEVAQPDVDLQTLEEAADSLPISFGVYRALRDEKGNITDFRIVYVNRAACESNGLSKEEQIGHNLYEVFPNLSLEFRKAHKEVTETGRLKQFVQNTYRGLVGRGRPVITFDINIIKSGDGFISVWRDTSEERQEKMELMFESERDFLTGLVNRVSFFKRLDDVIAEAHRYNSPSALVFLDLDGFKALNDSNGHLMGDDALKKVAQILMDRVRETDIAARVGGDEMAVILRHTEANEAVEIAEEIRGEIERAFASDAYPITASFGISLVEPYTAATAEILFRIADEAMYRAKQAGGNRIELVGSGEMQKPEGKKHWSQLAKS